jgi:hypothetical protein
MEFKHVALPEIVQAVYANTSSGAGSFVWSLEPPPKNGASGM